jgi:hypothetical protein
MKSIGSTRPEVRELPSRTRIERGFGYCRSELRVQITNVYVGEPASTTMLQARTRERKVNECG